MVEFQVIGAGLGIVLLGVSAHQFWGGIRGLRLGKTLQAAKPLSDGTNSGEMAVVEGTIDGPTAGPFLESGYSRSECVAYATTKIKQKAYGNQDVHRANNVRERIRRKYDAIPFIVKTEGESIHVNASNAEVDVSDDHLEPVSLGDVRENRGIVAGLFWLIRAILTTTDRQIDRTYLEAVFRPGDPVLAIGEFDQSGTNHGTLREPADGRLFVSSNQPDTIVDRLRSEAKGRLFRGVVLFAIATVVLLATAGII